MSAERGKRIAQYKAEMDALRKYVGDGSDIAYLEEQGPHVKAITYRRVGDSLSKDGNPELALRFHKQADSYQRQAEAEDKRNPPVLRKGRTRRDITDSLQSADNFFFTKKTVPAVIGIVGIIVGIFFLSNNITGNVTGISTTSNILGVVLLLVGIIGTFFWFRGRKIKKLISKKKKKK